MLNSTSSPITGVSRETTFTPRIVGLGEVLWDLLPSGKSLGGAPANFAFHANQLGACGVVVSAVGNDDLGREILTRFQELGLPETGIRTIAQPTGTVTVTMTDGQPSYTIHRNVAWDEIPWDTGLAELAAQTDAVCFGSLAQRSIGSQSTLLSFLDATPPDCLRIFDINLRQRFYNRDIVESSLIRAHVFKLNHEELPIVAELLNLPNGSEDETLASLLKRYHLRLIALTRGAQGSRLYSKWRISDHPGHPVTKFVDAVGAGDSFTATLAVGLLKFDDLHSIHDRAARIASYVCSQAGATPLHPL